MFNKLSIKPTCSVKPTESELAILNILWQQGASTVRQVYEALSKDKTLGYTTALKLMQIMAEKGLLKRDETERSHVYYLAEARETTQQRLVSDLLERAFAGSKTQLVLQALNAQSASSEELAEIHALLKTFEPKYAQTNQSETNQKGESDDS